MKTLRWTLAILLITGCEEKIDISNSGKAGSRGIFIVNEGSFGSGNGDISFYDFDSLSISNGLYHTANGAFAGDIVQDILLYDTLAVIISNNSNKIRIVNRTSFKLLRTITTSQPRLIANAENGRAFITGWDGYLKVLDMTSLQITDSLSLGSALESVILIDNKIYVANYGFGYDNNLFVIDRDNLSVQKTVRVGYGPRKLEYETSTGRLYAACEGNEYSNPKKPGGVYVVKADALIDSISAISHGVTADTLYVGRLSIRKNKGYMISGYYGPIQIIDLPSMTLTDSIDGLFYNVAVNSQDAADDQIYATETLTVPGLFKIYNSMGLLQETYEVGDFPSTMVFQR